MKVIDSVRGLGGVAATHELLRRGHSPMQLLRAMEVGEVYRPRKGWYIDPGLGAAVARAVRVGGRLDCVSAAVHHGLWVPDHGGRLHVAVPGTASRLRTQTDHHVRLAHEPDDALVVHWDRLRRPGDRRAVSVSAAIDSAFRWLDVQSAFILLESALRKGRLDLIEHLELIDRLPRHVRRQARQAGFQWDSGSESALAFQLRRLGIRFIQQHLVDDVGPVDFLIGDRLVVEIDSRAQHSDPYRDRRRDAELSARGYRVLRFMYSQIMFEWPSVERAILAAMVRGDHDVA